ncbi:hypothetical protein NHH03_24910 [Stieleria sp. TO1_6]|uniref:hypothetical protein n=1 Tax=Stieleria tagensis TaxID=2956795 RepID=UPI00209B675A|nr:hypothetical protein [Stieleria tagensis]MCO8125001.1 hypothetical protein [Stieleria tagensis]
MQHTATAPHATTQHATPSHHLATITPIADRDAGQVLSLGWKLFLNACLLLIPTLLVGSLIPVLGVVFWFAPVPALWLLGIGLVLVLVVQVRWATAYPEWPMNRVLVRRLRSVCKSRSGQSWIDNARLVEWVPRENWAASKLETAEDVMLIRVSDDGIEMEGDFARYWFPPESIIDVETESVRPAGCVHALHYVILVVRTSDGPQEFPLSYRDLGLGQLSSTRRYRQTIELAHQIRGIARGGDLTYGDPAARSHPAHLQVRPRARSQVNPYAAPRAV